MTKKFDPRAVLERDMSTLGETIAEQSRLNAQDEPDRNRMALLSAQESELERRIDLCTGIVEGRFVLNRVGMVVPVANGQEANPRSIQGDIAA